MSRSQSYSYPPYTTMNQSPPKQYPAAHSMSSAFSASANPNEDWTKISDLAERRRIQNRIAQRNYRKKLKKRLEDLERRAGSSSASPEAQPLELARTDSVQSNRSRAVSMPDSSRQHGSRDTDAYGSQYLIPPTLPSDGMFSQQYTRQISTSPPPFTHAQTPMIDSYAFQPANTYYATPPMSVDQSISSQYMPPIMPQYSQHISGLATPPIKDEYYGDDDMNPFSMSYASIAPVDIPTSQTYQEMAPYTPSLLDSFELSSSTGSPEDSFCNPHTPPSMAHSPPFYI